ncbi:MAG: META domain-containing protein [Dehalococcoidales bacterium]|jgi:heat shock protein HslJ|nr:META domain-containing protein [Dehalococcoidales bacterium]
MLLRINPGVIFGITLLVLFGLALSVWVKPGAGPLEGTIWILELFGEPGNLVSVQKGTKITAIFSSTQKRVEGSAGCNDYFGDYQLSDNTLTFVAMGHTEMYCTEPEGVMAQETQYLKILSNSESYQVTDGAFQVNSGNEILIYSTK